MTKGGFHPKILHPKSKTSTSLLYPKDGKYLLVSKDKCQNPLFSLFMMYLEDQKRLWFDGFVGLGARALKLTSCVSKPWEQANHLYYMGVSENRGGPPKSSISIGFSIINHPFWDTPVFGKHPYTYTHITCSHRIGINCTYGSLGKTPKIHLQKLVDRRFHGPGSPGIGEHGSILERVTRSSVV